jgi:hypothetical protein
MFIYDIWNMRYTSIPMFRINQTEETFVYMCLARYFLKRYI